MMSSMPNNRRESGWQLMAADKKMLIAVWSLVAAVVVLGIIIIVMMNAQTAATKEADYRACLAERGIYETADIDEMVSYADACYSSVYGER